MSSRGESSTGRLSPASPRRPQPFLCGNCWAQLPPAAQRALNARGDRGRALARLRQFHDHIDAGRPLGELEITL